MNETDRSRVYRHLRARFAFLLDRDPDVVMECYAWAWVFSAGAMDAKSIDKACRAQAMALGWRRRSGIGAWYRRERCMPVTLELAGQDRVMLRSNGPCVPRVRNARFKQNRHVPHVYRQAA
jgi:hypothetical protein